MERRRICFVGWGDHVHVERWAGYFARIGHEVSVISFSGEGRYPPGVRQYVLGMKGRGPRWVQWRLRYLLWRIAPDLVHVHWAHFAVPVQAVWHGPLVVTAWGSDVYRRDQFDDGQWRALGDALRTADLVTCDSDDMASSLRDAFDLSSDQVKVIQWGVDTDMFSPSGPDLRHAQALENREVVLSARNFTPLYNQETVVRAFAQLREQRPSLFLLMKSYGGDPDYLAKMRAEIDRLGLASDVRILNAVPYDEMPQLYRTADVTVSVPLSDATPMALFEAMASGSPCVVCDLPSLREWVTHGETGFLVDPVDVDALARAIERALEKGPPREHMRQRARELMVAKASQRAHMAVAEICYAAICDATRAAA
jgi:glycosyltransferase involved in cell wall biosynthesis